MLNLISIISLAFVDAINPCALAVMALVLMTILLQNPSDRRKVLLAGLAFTSAVFLLYFFYGAILVKFFSALIPATGKYSYYLFKGFGVFSVVLGLLNVRDYLNYKPGSLMTEMPLSFRPKMRSLIKNATSIKGAFFVGIFVTLFLLPCTIGPYIIASGELSKLSFLAVIPWLIIYNFVFILPMIAITLIIYFSLTTIDKVTEFRDRKIKKIHLVEGIILIILGIAMVTGLI